MYVLALASKLVARKIGRIDLRLLNKSEGRLRDRLAPALYTQGYPGAREAYLPRFRAAWCVLYHPRIKFLEIEVSRIRNRHPIKYFFLSQKLRHGELRSPLVLQKKTGDIDAG